MDCTYYDYLEKPKNLLEWSGDRPLKLLNIVIWHFQKWFLALFESGFKNKKQI